MTACMLCRMPVRKGEMAQELRDLSDGKEKPEQNHRAGAFSAALEVRKNK